MQKQITYIVLAIIVLTLTLLCTDTYAQVVNFPDPNLRAAIREQLNIVDQPKVKLDASILRRFLRHLDAGNRGISDLTGLEHATSLNTLFLHNNDISDLRTLSSLVNLTFLRLHGNRINDLSPLANLTELTTLPLDSNNITDISPLANLTQLTALSLGHNNITDISPLANLTGLMHLVLSNNNIMDIIPLANLTSLKHLELQNNRITDISPLQSLTNLDYLDTQNNPIFDANSPVVEIPDPNLRAAIRKTLKLSDGVPVNRAFMRQLTSLDAENSQITYLTGLEFATNLIWLHIPNNPISDLTPIAGLTRLETLNMWWTPISNIRPLANLTELRRLVAGGCDIVDINPLANLTQLTWLNLAGNKITDIKPLANLSQLQRLYLEANDIADIDALATLTQLEYLELRENRIVDVSSLAGLSNLRHLEIHRNQIVDHSPLDNLRLTHYFYDQTCDLPPLPLQPRLENRTFPSLVAAWGGPGWIRTLNRPELLDTENLATHDLWFSTPQFGTYFRETSDNIQMVTPYGPSHAIANRHEFLIINPNMIFLVDIDFRHARIAQYPEAWPYWLRDASGNLVVAEEGDAFINFTLPGFQDRIVEQAVAISKCGLFDGIMIDWWNDDSPLLVTRNPSFEYVGYEAEIEAKINILERIRAETRPNFLIIGNTNRRKILRTGKYLNGGFMETLVPRDVPENYMDALLAEIESSLFWLETNLREPRINSLEGWSVPTEPPDSPTNLRWMRTFTTLSLTHSDGYVLFQTGGGHHHYWYDFWGADLGRPVGPKSQLYDEDIPGLYIREFTNGWAVYNHSGETQVITLPEEVQGVASGQVNTEHALPNIDGEMYLKAVVSDQSPVTSKNPADVNKDGVVNILDLTIVAQSLGTDSLKGDVNGDGVVNVLDLVFVANQF